MMTKFDVGEEVYLKAVVQNIKVSSQGEIKYTLTVEDVPRNLTAIEDIIVKKEDDK